MINLLEYIYSNIKTVCTVYQEKVPPLDPITQKKTEYPYAVFKMANSTENNHRDDVIIEIDIWDNISDTTRLETLTSDIDKRFHRQKYIDSKMQVSFYRENRLQVPDPDETIRRRQLRYVCKTYFIK